MALINTQYDDLLLIKGSYMVGESSAGFKADASTALVVDFGAGFVEGNLILNISVMDLCYSTGSVTNTTGVIRGYKIALQLSNVAAFGSQIREKCSLHCGQVKQLVELNVPNADVDISGTGTYTLPFNNEINGTTYRYARIHTVVGQAGDTANSGITYSAYLGIH